MAQSIPGVPIPSSPPPGICGAFVILVLEKLQMPLGGAQNKVQNYLGLVKATAVITVFCEYFSYLSLWNFFKFAEFPF